MPVLIVPGARMGLGPALLYLFGMIGVLIWLGWSKREPKPPTKEELAEIRNRETFERLMREAAEARKTDER